MGMSSWMNGLIPFAAMVAVESLDVGLSTLSKAAMSRGMNHFVFVLYSNALSTLILLPFLFLHRKKRPPLSFSLLCKFFLLSVAGILMLQNCVFTGVSYSSPTLASAMSNLVPAFTFMLAVFFRIEKLELGSSKSQIKILGTIVSISGALVVTIYKGPAILVPPFQQTPAESSSPTVLTAATSNWIIGGLFLAVADLCLAIWNTAQAAILKDFPSQMTVLWFYYFFGTLQCAVLTLAVVRDPSAWTLTTDIEIISILYSAVFGSVVTYSVLSWCIGKKGPLYVVMFKPLGIAIAAFMSTIFLGDTLYIGSVIGAIFIVIGFYGVIWAQSEEGQLDSHGLADVDQSSSPRAPLLESHKHVANKAN